MNKVKKKTSQIDNHLFNQGPRMLFILGGTHPGLNLEQSYEFS